MSSNSSILEVELAGGLGNQLFMFYAGLYFSQALNKEVIYDISDFSRIAKIHPGHNLQTLGFLDDYEVRSKASARINFLSESAYAQRALSRLLTPLKKGHNNAEFRAQELGYVASDLIPPNTRKIRGYFQTWRYFSEVRQKPVLTAKSVSNQTNWFQDKSKQAKDERPIALHIRKGDYLLPKNRKIGLLAHSYYKSFFEKVNEGNPVWIFTDSPQIVSQDFRNLGQKIEIIQPPTNSDPVESLLLLSMASEIVISNSTFSWWAAQISGSDTKVYAPSKWFELGIDPTDLYPKHWTVIESQWETAR